MDVRIQSIHFDASEQLQAFIQKKVSKLEKYYEDIKKVEAILKLRHRKMCIRFVHCYSTKRMNRHLDWVLQIV